MRKEKTIKIDDKEFTVKELRVKDIRKVMEMAEQAEQNETGDLKQIETLLPYITDMKVEDLEEMAPSEIKVLWEGFKEVNSDFLSMIERLGIMGALGGLIRQHLTDTLAGLSKEATETSGSTDGGSS